MDAAVQVCHRLLRPDALTYVGLIGSERVRSSSGPSISALRYCKEVDVRFTFLQYTRSACHVSSCIAALRNIIHKSEELFHSALVASQALEGALEGT